jgi:hypothetical protein
VNDPVELEITCACLVNVTWFFHAKTWQTLLPVLTSLLETAAVLMARLCGLVKAAASSAFDLVFHRVAMLLCVIYCVNDWI